MIKIMKISVIIPVFNAEKFLRRCLDSVLIQTISEKEIICVDDGSTDCSLAILEEYSEKYDNIHILCQKNQYAGIARNNGLLLAKGEYIHFLDADDYILGDVYSAIYKLATSMNADYVKTRNIAFDMTNNRYVENEYYSLKNQELKYFNKWISLQECPEILLKTSVAPWSGWVKRSYIEDKKILFNNLKCVNDRSFYIKLICNTDRIVLCDNYMVAHQVNNQDSLVGIRNKNFECLIKSYEMIKEMLNGFDNKLKKQIMTEELRSIVWIYIGQTEFDKIENEKMLKQFFTNFDWSEVDKEMLLESYMNYIYQRLQIHIWDIFDAGLCIDSFEDLRNCFFVANNIVIYGAGKVCEKLIEYLDSSLKKISCIVVSDAKKNKDSIKGIPVKEKSKEILNQAQTIIIATLEDSHVSIYRTLIHMGYCNIKVISDELYKNVLG